MSNTDTILYHSLFIKHFDRCLLSCIMFKQGLRFTLGAFIFVSVILLVMASSDNDKLLNTVIEFCEVKKWKRVSIITDQKDELSLSLQFSKMYIPNRIFKSVEDFLQSTAKEQSELPVKIIVLCNHPCLENVTQHNLFYKYFHWLLIYCNNTYFIKEISVLKSFIRVDSEVFALINAEDNISNSGKVVQLLHSNKLKVPHLTTILANDKINQLTNHQQYTPPLDGINLTVSVFHSPPVVFVEDNNGVITVKSIRNNLLNIFAKYLGFRIQYDFLHIKGRPLTTTFSGLWNVQRQKLRNSEIDMTGMFMPISKPDLVNISHSTDIFTVRLAILLRNIKYTPNSKNIFSVYSMPFTPQVWVYILIVVFLCVSLSFSASINQYYQFFGLHKIYSAINFYIHDTLTCYPSQGFLFIHAPSTSKKIIVTVSTIFTVFVNIHYNSVFTASLAADNYKIPFQSLEDLVNDGRFRIGALKNSPVELSIKESKTGVFHDMLTKSMYEPYETMDEGLRKTLHSNYAMFCPLEYCRFLNCSYAFLKTTYLPFHVTVNFPKNSPYVEIFSKFIMRMRSAGILYRNVRSFTQSHRHKCEISSDYEPVNLRESATPFIILVIGIVMSLLVLITEIMCL